jgi:hypothetical protein
LRPEDELSSERDRVISITLTETEWRAFVARHPQPVDWLREQIREELGESQDDPAPSRPAILST